LQEDQQRVPQPGVMFIVGAQAPSVASTQARSSSAEPSIIATGATSPNVTTLGGIPAASATACAARACWCVRRNPVTPRAASPKAKCRSPSTPAAAPVASNLSRIPSGSQAQALASSRGRNTGSPAPAIFAATWLIVCSSRVTLSAAAVAPAAQHTRPT
jgi:hypothetical protein